MGDHGTDTLEGLRARLRDGFHVHAVDSDDDHVILTLRREDQQRTLQLGRDAAKVLLTQGLEGPEPIPA